jgi:hypothetical protein
MGKLLNKSILSKSPGNTAGTFLLNKKTDYQGKSKFQYACTSHFISYNHLQMIQATASAL